MIELTKAQYDLKHRIYMDMAATIDHLGDIKRRMEAQGVKPTRGQVNALKRHTIYLEELM